MNKFKYIGCMILVWLNGFIVCSNLVHLVETNKNYDASWFKVAFSIFLVIMFSSMAYHIARKDR